MTKLSLGRLGAGTCFRDPTSTIRKLLARAGDPRCDHFEAISARTIAHRLICENVRRGAVRFEDIFEYDQTKPSKPSRGVLLPTVISSGLQVVDFGDFLDLMPQTCSTTSGPIGIGKNQQRARVDDQALRGRFFFA
jgi:hypothetical protein